MDPKIEEGIAIEFGYVEEGMGEEVTQTEEVQTEEVEQIQDVEVSAPEEQTEISEEVVTQDVEDAPVINEDNEEEKIIEFVDLVENVIMQKSIAIIHIISIISLTFCFDSQIKKKNL